MPFDYETITSLYDSDGDVIDANKGTYTHLTRDILLELREDVDYLGVLRSMAGANWTANLFDWTKGTTIALDTAGRHWLSYITDLRTACEELYTDAGIGAPSWTIATVNLVPIYDAAGDIVVANKATYTDVRLKSLYTDIRTALIAVANETFIFVDDAVGNDSTGDGTEGDPYKTWDKAVQVVNAAATGNIYFQAGTYECDDQLTTDNVIIRGASLGDVIFKDMLPSDYICDNCDNLTVENIYFFVEQNISRPRYFLNCFDMIINTCIFTYDVAWTTNTVCLALGCADATFNHCTFIGDSNTRRGLWVNEEDLTINDCLFYDLDDCVYPAAPFNGAITENNCGFYDYNDIYDGNGTYAVTDTNRLITDPIIVDRTTAYLDDASPYINQASDGFDIGAYKDSPYNLTITINDTIGMAESILDNHVITINDTIGFAEDITEVNVNATIDMALWGLLKSSGSGVIDYLDATEAISSAVPGYVYNGASVDFSFDNTNGDRQELYIAVDDGITGYDSIVWWEQNAYQTGDPGRNYAGFSASTYIIDGWKDYEGNEWGEGYSFSTIAADGVNDQQADITLKIRLKNTITGNWSELLTLSNTYYFNDFDTTMYYFADNPRSVDDEYADHANYYANQYHTNTDKYTRADGVDWADDDRRYAYNPMFKAERHMEYSFTTPDPISFNMYTRWVNRKIGSLSPAAGNTQLSHIQLYACIYCNYGNWNDSGAHCFAVNSTQAFDGGTQHKGNPVLGSDASDLHYIGFTNYTGADCSGHGSQYSIAVRSPSDENIVWGDFFGKPIDYDDDDLYFQQGDNPHVGCRPDNRFFLWITDQSATFPGGFAAYASSREVYYVNTDSNGNPAYGGISAKYSVTATPAGGTINTLW